jgi:hypothetical protein
MIGETIKHYHVEALIGQGGMGVVYRARDTRLGRVVALKVLPPDVTRDEGRKARFLLEARAASAVNHPAIAQIYDVDEGPSGLFIAMELVEGRTVRALVQARELDLLGSLEIAAQVASGLQKAHEAGIVHRDIKPENVAVTPEGHAKILDFGLAKLLEPTGETTADELSHMETLAKTQSGMVIGTLRYMSPEQARGQAVDHRSDIFSLGVLLYEMVTGQLPFSGNTALDTLHAIAFEETRAVTTLRPNLPASLQRVISRCLRKRSQDRYAEAKDLAAELRTVQREVESGVSGRVPLGVRLREHLQSFRELAPAQWILPLALGLSIVALAVVLFGRPGGISFPGVLGMGVAALFIWRRFRNRRIRLARRFAARARKMPEVRLVALDGMRFTVVADHAQARTYVRTSALVDSLNASMFFGGEYSVVVRDAVGPDEFKALLAGPGLLFVREEKAGVST